MPRDAFGLELWPWSMGNHRESDEDRQPIDGWVYLRASGGDDETEYDGEQ